MHFSTLSGSFAIMLAGAKLASAHGVFVDAYGDADPSIRGYGLGYGHDTERKGTWLFPHQKDVPVFSNKIVHNKWWKNYTPDGCGVCVDSVAGWYQKNRPEMWDPKITSEKARWAFLHQVSPSPDAFIQAKAGVEYLNWLEKTKKTRLNRANGETLNTGIPKVTAGGSLNVMNYQINLDGAGPFKCKISFHGDSKNWTRGLTVTKNCPGDGKSLFWPGIQKPCWFTIAMPSDMDCTGSYGVKNICMVRCENNADNGPFGGCIPVEQIKPVAKPVVSKKPVQVTVVHTLRPTVAPPKVVFVTKDHFVTIIKDDKTVTSVVTKDSTVTITQVIRPPPQTTVEIKYEEVVVGEIDYGPAYKPDPKKDDAKKPIPNKGGPANKKPTKEEIKAAMGGEDYESGVASQLENESINDNDKSNLQAANKNKHPINSYYKRKLRARSGQGSPAI
ncbi:hypothetical protein TWF481_004104 [Arthrobotrys musiformis]|uniref:Uncharacterized protein n=1 Tax=Arthrobotrys musiformis TaxID=47236 RepID=A0AAV9WIK3_9PEZI